MSQNKPCTGYQYSLLKTSRSHSAKGEIALSVCNLPRIYTKVILSFNNCSAKNYTSLFLRGYCYVSVISSNNSCVHVNLRGALCLASSSHGGSQLLEDRQEARRDPPAARQHAWAQLLWTSRNVAIPKPDTQSSPTFFFQSCPYHPASCPRNLGLYV